MNENILNPKFGYTFADLFVSDKLKNLSEDFYKYFENANSEKFQEFKKYRDSLGEGYTYIQASEVIMNSSVYLSDFLGNMLMRRNTMKIYFYLKKNLFKEKYSEDLSPKI